MKIQTKYHGEIEITNDEVISFFRGIPGFSDEDKFILLDLQENSLFQVLQSIKTKDLGFIVIDPYHVYSNYAFDLDDQTVENLEITSPEQVKVLAIVSVEDPFEKSTLNLQAPLVINQVNLCAKQYVTNDKNHFIKAPLQPLKQRSEE
ncbi:flagellar assembly protein FliW [Paraliobacillus ryukyuensis]|uniref:flagellar assembly protein FliW n=1 Tax=Paraliobacillus ryukyuensis TaxID=200904 RepID=UPI0009A8C214|nr:flagellar assembly protein FliW [Paraliobacillus ryukyuensis]